MGSRLKKIGVQAEFQDVAKMSIDQVHELLQVRPCDVSDCTCEFVLVKNLSSSWQLPAILQVEGTSTVSAHCLQR
jgi:hypothetical protein